MSLAHLGALAAVATLIVVAWMPVKPVLNRWAAIRCLLMYQELRWIDLLTDEQLRSHPRRERAKRFMRNQQSCATNSSVSTCS